MFQGQFEGSQFLILEVMMIVGGCDSIHEMPERISHIDKNQVVFSHTQQYLPRVRMLVTAIPVQYWKYCKYSRIQ